MVSKDCESSSTVIFIYNMFVVCGLITGLVWMLSSVASLTAVLGMEYESTVCDFLFTISMFSTDL